MNNEIIYLHNPAYIYDRWDNVTEREKKELDQLARLMVDSNKNFDKLVEIWNKNRRFRMLKGGLL
jgi:hypothetical protein